MRRQKTFQNYSDSFLRHLNNDEEDQVSSNNFVNNKQSQATYLKNLSSSIISSADITRKSLLQARNITSTSNYDNTVDDDDDDNFFQKIKNDIDKNLLQNPKENYKLISIGKDIFPQRKRRPIIDEETQNIIKRFKKDAIINNTNFMQTPANNISTIKSNSFFNNTIRHPYQVPRNISGNENIMNQQNTKKSPTYNLPSTNNVGNTVTRQETIRCSYNLPASTNDIEPTVRQENTISYPKYNLLKHANAVGSILKPQTIFTSNDLHIRNPNKYKFQMCFKMQKDKILPLNKIKAAVVHTECKEVLYYSTTYETPPRRNFHEDD